MSGVVLGGLLTTTLVSLFVVPALFLRFGISTEPALSSAAYPRSEMPLTASDVPVPLSNGELPVPLAAAEAPVAAGAPAD
jgi:hypothetical protein